MARAHSFCSQLVFGAALCSAGLFMYMLLPLQALDKGVTQVVCIAAGYDTRAYRFARQGVKVSAAFGYYPPGRLLSGSQYLLFCALRRDANAMLRVGAGDCLAC